MDAAEPQQNPPGAADPSRAVTEEAAPLPGAGAPSPPAEAPYRSSEPSVFAATSPIDGSPLAPVDATPLSSIRDIVARARSAQKTWGELPVRDGIDAIAKLKKRIRARAEEMA